MKNHPCFTRRIVRAGKDVINILIRVPPRCIVRARRTVSDHHERLDLYVNMTGGGGAKKIECSEERRTGIYLHECSEERRK